MARMWQTWKDERGITGLETAIVLIAFVIVASVFAFTMMSTGLLATDKTRETVLGGLEETSASLGLRGSLIATANVATTTPYVETISFQVTAALSGGSVNLSTSTAVVTYIDEDQVVNSPTLPWTATWLSGGSGPLLDAGERVEIVVTVSSLTTKLEARKEFTIQLKPPSGGILILQRTTPAELTGAVDLG